MKIAVSVLGADYASLGGQIKKLENAGIDIISFDVMDGHFVNNITIGPCVIKSCRHVTAVPFECHLMVESPEKFIREFIDAGCDIITVHLESTGRMKEIADAVRKAGRKVAIAIKPGTHAKEVLPYLGDVDIVLIMTVEPGSAGQAFVDMGEKIKFLKNEIKKRGLKTEIMVDGGINSVTAKAVKAAGADILVSASYIMNNDYKAAIETLRNG